jgi:2-oxoglutarate ferredoxin oxidoreductase subunit alpha
VLEAAEELRAKGERVATMHFSQVWPLVPEQFMGHLQKAQRVISVEGNAIGQMARLIRRETGFQIKERILRYDGLPFTPEYILRQLKQ